MIQSQLRKGNMADEPRIQIIEDANAFLPPSVLRMVAHPKDQSPRETFDASRLKINLTSSPRPVPLPGSPELLSNKVCTDHMVTVRWTSEQGWADPELVPYGPLSLMPTASVLHYSTACFEGMKVYRGLDGKLRLFRPGYNCGRMLASALRISLPGFDPQQLLELIRKLCEVDGPKWLPQDRVVAKMWSARGLVAPAAKISGNYGPSLLAHGEAKKNGFDQVLWLFGSEGYVTEAGSSNFFAIWRTGDGKLQLVTAPLGEHTILAGVTRKSVIELTRTRLDQASSSQLDIEPLEVFEANFTISDLIKASDEERLLGAFAVGTACFMQLVVRIQYKERIIEIPPDDVPHIAILQGWMSGILVGNDKYEWTDVISEE
ncbi:hypothetical protein LT330_008353 [Penicillium expansum]|nr:hypothetical protein LT330_008353 [Penicillium expansum]